MAKPKTFTYQLRKHRGFWVSAKLRRFYEDKLSFCDTGMVEMWPKVRHAMVIKATVHFEKPPHAKRYFRMASYSQSYVDVYYHGDLRRPMSEQLSFRTGNMLSELVENKMFWITIEVLE